MCDMSSFVDADARRQLVVPPIYFWCGAHHMDAPQSGAVCGQLDAAVLLFNERRMLSKACHITSPPAETDMQGAQPFFFFFSNSIQGNCWGQSSSSLQHVAVLIV